jgi:hypothetical protein
MDFLIQNGREDQLRSVLTMAQQVNPAFVPQGAATRHALAETCHEAGDFMAAAKLVNGLHKLYPDYPRLVPAYELMLDCVQQLPELASKVEPLKKLVATLQSKAPAASQPAQSTETKQPKDSAEAAEGKAAFEAKELSQPTGKASFEAEEPSQPPVEPDTPDESDQGEDDNSGELAPIEFK